MKKNRSSKVYVAICILAGISLIGFQRCTFSGQKNATYQDLLAFSDGIKVINTHEHQHTPVEYNLDTLTLYDLIYTSYLMQDVISAGGARPEIDPPNGPDLQEQWKIYGKPLNYTRSTSYYSHFVKGIQKLYDFEDLYFTENNIPPLSKKIRENYLDYEAWFHKAFQIAGFEVMFNDRYWNSLNTEIDTEHFALVFHINDVVLQSSNRPAGGEELHTIYEKADEEGFSLLTLDDYLKYCDHLFQKQLKHNVVCLKNSMAYSRTIMFNDVSYEEARNLFARPSASLSRDEATALQDYMFHWIIQKSIEYDLPIQIHTGYLAGNGNQLDHSHPLKLNHLFSMYPTAKFSLFHGAYPWTSEFIAMGKMYQNVYLDLVWLPQISREKAVLALDEMLDCVPYNKIFWGGDCAFIEQSTGALEFAKSVLAETLSKRIERGLLSEDVAYEIIERILRENAIEVFKLEEKLKLSQN